MPPHVARPQTSLQLVETRDSSRDLHDVRQLSCAVERTLLRAVRRGAARIDERPLTVRRFVNDLWNELSNVDSGTMRTLRTLVVQPGELTMMRAPRGPLPDLFDAISVAYWIALGIYFFISARRIFSQSAAKTAVK